jgi:hypothetical protein
MSSSVYDETTYLNSLKSRCSPLAQKQKPLKSTVNNFTQMLDRLPQMYG